MQGSRHEEQIKCRQCGRSIVISQLEKHMFLVHTELGREQCKTMAERHGRHGRKNIIKFDAKWLF